MLPVVPNLFDAVSGKNLPKVKAASSTLSVKMSQSSEKLIQTTGPPAYFTNVTHHMQGPFFSHRRTGRGDLVCSMQLPQELRTSNWKNHQPAEELDGQSGFLTSVNVVPKTSGGGYDVHSFSHCRHYTSHHEGDAASAVALSEESYFSGSLRPKSSSDLGSQYSMNISNPALKKRMQSKMFEATSKVSYLRSSNTNIAAGSTFTLNSTFSTADISKQLNRNDYVLKHGSPAAEPVASMTEADQPSLDHVDSPVPFDRMSPSKGMMQSNIGPDPTFNFQDSFFNSPNKDPLSPETNSGAVNREAKTRPTSPKLEYETPVKSPNLQPRLKNDPLKNSTKRDSYEDSIKQQKTKKKSRALTKSNENNNRLECNCILHHAHQFKGDVCNLDIQARKEQRQKIILNSLRSSSEDKLDMVNDPRNVFWIPSLSFHPYKHGDSLVSFSSLWPRYRELKEQFQNSGIQQTVLNAVNDLCTLACTCGPMHLLRCLIDLELIRADQVLENGYGLLDLAVLANKMDCIQYLMDARDKQAKKHGAAKNLAIKDTARDRIQVKASLQDKGIIFKLATNPKMLVEIQKKLQTLDFNVNTELDDSTGDFLLHLVIRQGLSQLPLLMTLVNLQKADIELCNADGMTPLMLAAASGNFVLCDVLMCVFGANPNKPNPQSGRGALHYAAESNHQKVVECLIKRGADVNMEDHEGLRADDIPTIVVVTDDCREVIMSSRANRMETLCEKIKIVEISANEIRLSDFYVVNSEGHTLIMVAALHNKYVTLQSLLEFNKTTINAQHSQTGMTALAMAASLGHIEAVSVLLRYKASPMVVDMCGYLPLHRAILKDQEHTVDIFLDHFPSTYTGLYQAIRICKKSSIHSKLRRAWFKRQEEIITPKLLSCALSGDAEELYRLLEDGDNINPKSATGNWPVYLAVENGNLQVLKLLLEKGGDMKKRHITTGATVLHVAAKMGHYPIVSFLMQYCKQYQRKLETPRSKHDKTRSPNALQKAVSQPVSRKRCLDINAIDREKRTALQLAAERGFSKIVELLLSHGATTAMLDGHGNLFTCPQYDGVRMIIDSHRQQHTLHIMSCLEDKSKKGLAALKQIWLPKFDHHLRDKEGNTPLMVAARKGKINCVEFLLESAVYPEILQYESESDTESDTDSGMLDPANELSREEDLQSSLNVTSFSFNRSISLPSDIKLDLTNSGHLDHTNKLISRNVSDANKPKGLSIYHDGLVSHVCAVSLMNGTTALHQALRTGDAVLIVSLLLNADPTALNIQDDKGETILHTACRLKRKKCIEFILNQPDLDLDIRTKDGCLVDELTSSKANRKFIQKARSSLAKVNVEVHVPYKHEMSVADSEHSMSVRSSTVNFDKVHNLYEALKQNGVAGAEKLTD